MAHGLEEHLLLVLACSFKCVPAVVVSLESRLPENVRQWIVALNPGCLGRVLVLVPFFLLVDYSILGVSDWQINLLLKTGIVKLEDWRMFTTHPVLRSAWPIV